MGSTANIPIIDLATASDVEQEKVAKELVDAAIKHGFVYIRNRGADIPVNAVGNAFDLGKKILAAPIEEKQKCAIQKNNRGWSAMHAETLDPKHQKIGDFKEAFNFGEFRDGKAQQPIPESVASYEGEYSAFYDHCYNLSLKINHLLGIGLGVKPPDFFRYRHLRERGATGNILRFLYYPPPSDLKDATPADVRAGAHSDYGSITLLFRLRGQAGLEIDTTGSNDWAPVPVCPPGTQDDPLPPVLVNIGDLLSYWTNGLLRSTVHRVTFPGADGSGGDVEGESSDEPRYSIAFFCHPVGSTSLDPVPSERVRNYKPPHGEVLRGGIPEVGRRAITADEHLHMRLRASYLQLYDEKEEK